MSIMKTSNINRRKHNRKGKKHCEICGKQRILVQHHIMGRDIPNPNHKYNLCDVCDNDHRDVHEGIIIIEGWFQTTAGMELIWHYKDEEGLTGKKANPFLIP